MTVENTLREREKQYGSFKHVAYISQSMKSITSSAPGFINLVDDQKEALEMIYSKIGRILAGNCNHADTWHDIAGYAQLIAMRLSTPHNLQEHSILQQVQQDIEEQSAREMAAKLAPASKQAPKE